MNGEKPRPARGWTFRAFLSGVALGAVFGAATAAVWDRHGPQREQIAAAFWALVGGALGLAAGRVRHGPWKVLPTTGKT